MNQNNYDLSTPEGMENSKLWLSNAPFLYGDQTMNQNNYDLSTPEGMENSKLWLSNALTLIGDNGIWGIPRSSTVVRIDKQNKTATVVAQGSPDVSIELVFEALGWTVEYADSGH